jgi:autotransporter-associated beta strand protein
VTATYSGSSTIAPATFAVTGLVNGETITGISSAVINDKNVSANAANFIRSITISGGTAVAGNYSFGSTTSTTAGNTLNTVALTAKSLTVAGTLADAKVYDGTSTVKVWGGALVGVIGTDVVTLRQSGTLNSPNVGSAIPITMTNTISGFSAGNYSLVQPSGVTGVVTPRTITISDGTVAHKVYDGTTNAVITGGTLVGVLSGDASNVTLTQAGRFSSPNVSNGIIIITSASISGSAAGNYTLVQPAGITANITPAMLGISVVGIENGTNTITPISFTINGLIGGQTITGLSSVSVKSSSISSNGSNFVTGIVISGGTALATNYAFAPSYDSTAGATQNIATLVAQNQKILTVTGAVAASKVYDGTTSVVISGGTLVGLTAGHQVTLVQSGLLVSPNVSTAAAVALNYSITGTHAGNYVLVQPSGITTIVTPAPLGIAITGEYNGTTTLTPTSFTVTGLVNSETITALSSATVSAINVSNNGSNYVTSIVSGEGTALLSNYSITPSYNATSGNTKNVATITAKALTVGGSPVASNKVYDGLSTATITGGSLVGVVGSDVVTLNQLGAFAQATVGDDIAVTSNFSLGGLSSANYSLVQPTGITGNITAKQLSIGGVTVSNKVYDGLTGATVTGGTLTGLVGSDGANVILSQSGEFASANVANGISVAVTGSISGSASGNYTLVQPDAVTANITPKTLTVSGTVVADKTYDRTTDASVTAGTLVGVISGDVSNVTLTRSGVFTSSNVGSDIAVTMTNSISGSAASNYILTQPSGVTADITAKALTITANDVSSVYGSTTNLGTSGFTQSGLISGDSINAVTLLYSGSSAVAATVNADTYSSAITASAATGSGLSNYAISYVAGDLSVDKATLTAAPIAKSVVYNGNTLNAGTFSASASNYTVIGYKNADSASDVSLSFTGSLGFTLNGSSASVLNAGTYAYSAGDLSISTSNTNYRVVLAGTLTNQYTVTPATVSLSVSKIYDASATFTAGDSDTNFAVVTGVGSQTLGISGSALANSANVTSVNNLNTNGLMLVDGTGLASNYVLPASTGDVVITPKSINVSIVNQSKVYDSTKAATLTAGTSSSDGSYLLSGFMGNDGAYITQTVATYNSANVASATSVTASVGSAYVAKDGTVLSNYSLPASVATASNGASITPAALTMTADNVSTFVGVAPNLTYQLTGLVGSDTANTAISDPEINYTSSLLNTSMSSPTLSALTPSATSSNYTLTFVKGSLMVADNYQMIVNAGSSATTYGLINAGNSSYLGNVLATGSGVSAGYCTNCGEAGVSNPNIINLTITAPASGSNVWTAFDAGSGAAQGRYNFEITPTIDPSSYASGGSLNVGNYVLTPGNLSTVAGYTTNYAVAKPIIYNTGSLAVSPKTLTVTGTTVANKTYDATTAATIVAGQLVGVVATDVADIGLVQSGNFASINVANNISVTVVGSLTGSVAANYALTDPTDVTGNITPASLTISGLTAANKAYDANTTASITGTPSIIGLFGSDVANLSGSVTGAFSQSNVGSNLSVTVNVGGLSVDNNNYVIGGVTNPLVADITPAKVTVSASKTYDGSSSVAANQITITGVAGQSLTLSSASSGSLSNPNVGSAALTALNDATLVSGTGLADNYTLVDPTFSTVIISPAEITVGVDNLTKVYDRSLSTASTSVVPSLVLKSGSLFVNESTGLQDTLSGGSFAYSNANAGINKTVNVSNASVISGSSTITTNYSITYEANTSSVITAAPVTISGLTATDKVYNRTDNAVLSGTPVIASGLLGGDTSNISGSATAGAFATTNVGTGIAVTANLAGLTLSNGNYYVAGVATALSADITAAPVTISGLTVANKVYDTTSNAVLSGTAAIAGLLSGDAADLSGTAAAGTFASANVGTGIAVSANLGDLTLSNGNYYISGLTTALTADITAAPLTISGLTAANKVYNRTDAAILSGTPVIASGLLGSDSASISGSASAGTFASANVGAGIAVTANLTGLTLSNSNYYLAGVASELAADITAAPVTISGLTAANKVYDATNAVTITGTPTISGLISGDSSSVSGSVTGVFASVNADTGIAINTSLSGLSISNSNYYVAGLTSSLTADITQAPLTITADNKSMVYGSTAPALTYAFTGLVGTDISAALTGSLESAASSSAVVGSYGIAQGSLAVTGNYRIGSYVPGNVTINARPVTVTVDAGQTKVYGNQDPSTLSITVQAEGANDGLLTGATLSGNVVRAVGENVGAYGVTEGTLASANPNYAITLVANDFTITPRLVTVVIADQTKSYDSTSSVTLTAGTNASGGSYTLSGFIAGEGAYITQTVAAFNSANVSGATAVTASVSSSYVAKAGTLLSNYTLPASVSTRANGASITPVALTMTADNVSTFVGVAPTLTYQLTGLVGTDTASTAISDVQINYSSSLLNAPMTEPAVDALTPSATSSNYTLRFVKGSLLVAGNYQIIVNTGSNTASYGLINETNASYLANALSSSNSVTAGYCTDCVADVESPTIVRLTITAPSAGSNVWIAADGGTGDAQGRYSFKITPTINSSAYGAGKNLNVGNYVLSASDLALLSALNTDKRDPNKPTMYNVGSLTITPKELTVTGTTVANKTYDATDLAAVSNGQLVGVVSGDTTHIGLTQTGNFTSINVGTNISVNARGTLTGSVAANYTLTEPTGLAADITVAPVTISGLTASNKVYDKTTTAELTGTAVITGLFGADTASLSSAVTAGTFATANKGTGIVVTADLSGLTLSNSNYSIVGVTSPLTANITAAPVTIGGLSAADKLYDASLAASFTGTPTITGLLTGDSSTVSGSVTGVFANANVGSDISVTVNLNSLTLSNSNYYVAALSSGLSADITQAPLTVTADNKSMVYGSSVPSLTYVYTGLVGGETSASFTGELASNASASASVGNAYEVTQGTLAASGNYTIETFNDGVVTITARPVTITVTAGQSKIYGNTDPSALNFTVQAQGNDVGLLTGTTLSGSLGRASGENVGSYAINVGSLSSSNTNYAVTLVGTDFVITPRPVNVTTNAGQSKVYGNSEPSTLSFTAQVEATDVGLLTGASLSGSLARAPGEDVGSYAINQGDLSSENPNYTITFLGNDFAITQRPITVTASSGQSKVYGEQDPSLSYSISAGSLASFNGVTDTLTGSLTRAIGESVSSTYAIGQGTVNNASNSNYNITYVADNFAITKRVITLSANSATKVYGQSDPTFGTTLTSGTLATFNGSQDSLASVTGSLGRSSGEDAGSYNILLGAGSSAGSLANNYDITYNNSNAAFSITRRDITVTAGAGQSKVYGEQDPSLSYSISAGSLASFNGVTDTLTGSLTRAIGESVSSTYAIGQGTVNNASNSNYNITYVADNFAITKRVITLSANSATKVYGQSDPTFGTTLTSGTLATFNGSQDSLASVTGSLSRSVGENVGNYNLLLGSGVNTNNYNITFEAANQAFVITKATLTAVGSKSYDGSSAVVGSDIVVSGVNGQTFTASGFALMSSKNVQTNQQPTDVSSLSLVGNGEALTSNYFPLSAVDTTISVTPRGVSLTAPTINKTYDGGYTYELTSADLSAFNAQLLGTDTFNSAKAVFAGNNPNVGTNKTVVIDPASVSIYDGNSGQNYAVSYIDSLGNITPARLFVTAANDAKFLVEQDNSSYAGAIYKGFVNGQSVANLPSGKDAVQISRSNPTINDVGTYVLTPSGHGAENEVVGNYQVSYINGSYTILGARDLLVRASSAVPSYYGSAPVYGYTAKYLAGDGTTLSYLSGSGLSSTVVNLTVTGSTLFTLTDGLGGSLTTGFTPLNAELSRSGNTNAGQYNLTAVSGSTQSGSSFRNFEVVGTSTISPLTITTPSLSGSSITKVYDGNSVVSSELSNLVSGSPQVIAGDAATLSAIGTYDNKNVGTAKAVTVNFAIAGVDAKNYVLSANQVSGNYGAITQLQSVTYIGPVGGDWSIASNWAGGAIPDLSNVANVIIPTGSSVSYDSAVAGPVTSQVAANGSLNLANAGGNVSLGGISGSGAIALGSNSLSLTAAASGNFSGVISGSGGLSVEDGTQILSGVNTYTGNTAIDAGASLIIAGSGSLGGGNYAAGITNNGVFQYTSSANQTLSGVISGSGTLDKEGAGTLVLSAANTYTGATTVDQGTLAITNAAALGTTTGGTTVTSGGTLDLQNVTGVAEPITLSGGTLSTSTGTSSVTAPMTITGASTIDVDGTQLTISNTISGTGSLDKEGAGTLVLSAANTYTGATTVDQGTLAITNAGALGTTTGGTTVNTGATLDLRNVLGVAEPITVNGGTLATSTGVSTVTAPMTITGASTIDVDGTQLSINNTISGTGSLDKEGAGTLVLSAANTYTGETTVDGGTLAITNSGALGSSAAGSGTTVNTGATLDLQNVTGVAEPITLNGGTLAVSTGTSSMTAPMTITGSSTMDVDGTQLTVTNTISGSGSLEKDGSGTLVLEAANTYTGATEISSGTLKLMPGASIAESEKVIVNGVLDLGATVDDVYIKSLGGSGSVLSTTAPNDLVITDAGDTFSGVISGSGGLTIAGGTQTLTGINTYTGPTLVQAGANLIAGAQSIPGDIVNNGSFGFNQSTAGTYSHNMSGTGAMVISGTGPITLTGSNTQAGGTTISDGASLIIGSVDALSGNTLQSNNGSLGIANGIVLSSLDVGGSVTLTTDISTTGAQSYNNIKLAPSLDNETTLQTVNSDITITGTLDGTVAKIQSIVINAGTGQVTLGDSIGSIARPNRLEATGSRIFILADILTGNTQTYNGAASIGDGTYIGKAFVKGFLFDDHVQYFDYAQPNIVSTVKYKNNDPRYVRTLVSMDPTVTFNGTVDDVGEYVHTLLVAAIAPDEPSARSASTMPIINFNDSISQTIPLFSVNAQTLVLNPGTTTPNLNVYVGEINLTGSVTTYSDQIFRSEQMNAGATNAGGELKFSVVDPSAAVVFNLPMKSDNSGINLINTNGGRDSLVINGSTNLSNALVSASFNDYQQNQSLGVVPTLSDSSTSNQLSLKNLKDQSELAKEENLVVGEVTIDELEEESIDCANPQAGQPLDPKCIIQI